jgi:hypothetical protein
MGPAGRYHPGKVHQRRHRDCDTARADGAGSPPDDTSLTRVRRLGKHRDGIWISRRDAPSKGEVSVALYAKMITVIVSELEPGSGEPGDYAANGYRRRGLAATATRCNTYGSERAGGKYPRAREFHASSTHRSVGLLAQLRADGRVRPQRVDPSRTIMSRKFTPPEGVVDRLSVCRR